jgi:SAM-dependent methyltransferase
MQRLAAIVELLKESNKRIEDSREAEGTGFLSFDPERIAQTVLELSAISRPPRSVLDLGCGNGQFALLAAAAGYPSYGIEIEPRLIDEARHLHEICVERNLIDKNIPCRFVAGDMIPFEYREQYRKFRTEHNENEASMPISEDTSDPYKELGTSIQTADIIYCWSWPGQSRFLYNLLEDIAKPDCVFILPSYERYTQGEHMNAAFKERNRLVLTRLAEVQGQTSIFIGRRAQ